MCGIVGVIGGSIGHKDVKIFKELLMVDTLRGYHGTGCMLLKDHHVDVIKEDVFGTDFVKHLLESHKTSLFQYSALIGHNRQATLKSTVNEDNCHPFQIKDTTLVHNGSLTNADDLLKGKTKHPVDSVEVCKSISHMGLKKTAEKSEGSFVYVSFNKRTSTISICRNKERPLHYTVIADMMYIASEAKMLDWILSRNGKTGYKIEEFPVGEIRTYKLSPSIVGKYEEGASTKFTPKETPIKSTNSSKYYRYFENEDDNLCYWRGSSYATKTKSSSSSSALTEVIGDKEYTYRELIDKNAEGCCICDRTLLYSNRQDNLYDYYGEGNHVCKECVYLTK